MASPVVGLTPERCDLLVVSENTEGLYAGAGGVLYKSTSREVATQESLNTRSGVERVIRDAFERARARRNRLTLCHKTNVLVYAGDLWQRTLYEVASEYPGVATDYVHADAMCLHLINSPERFDVVVTDNLFGDIITDVGAALQGGLGLAASGNIIRRAPILRCSNRSMVPHRTSWGRGGPIRWLRFSRPPCAWTISVKQLLVRPSRLPQRRSFLGWAPWQVLRWEVRRPKSVTGSPPPSPPHQMRPGRNGERVRA